MFKFRSILKEKPLQINSTNGLIFYVFEEIDLKTKSSFSENRVLNVIMFDVNEMFQARIGNINTGHKKSTKASP